MSATDIQSKKTPLYDLHLELGARLVPFASYSMPVQFPMGIKQEHLHTRRRAGLFDVSHMGQLMVRGSGVAEALERLIPSDLVGQGVNRQRYGVLTNERGGIRDDLMATRYQDGFYLVVNAATRAEDIDYFRAHLPANVELEELTDRALLALQGPSAEAVLATLNPKVREMVFMDNWPLVLDGNACFVSRSGYTGEDGFEISVPAAAADSLARRLLAHEDVAPIGLGARDSLRLEAGLCLYGHDIDANTTPPEAGLVWAIPKARRTGGERAGGFPGADVILPQIQNRNWARKRVGLVGADRVPVREGAALFNADNEPVGQVTSGTFSPSLGVPIAMGYVQAGYEVVDTVVAAEVRGRRIPLVVTRLPLVEQRYLR